MKNSMKKSCAIFVLFFIVIMFYSVLSFPYSELNEFKREFRIKLPMTTSLLYGAKEYGIWGDGYAVMIYKLRFNNIFLIEQQAISSKWTALPFDKEFKEFVVDNFYKYVPEEDMKKIPLDLTQGLYRVNGGGTYEFKEKKQFGDKETLEWLNSEKFPSCSLGIIDTKNGIIYLVKWDL